MAVPELFPSHVLALASMAANAWSVTPPTRETVVRETLKRP